MPNIYEALRADHDKQRTFLKILAGTSGASTGREEIFDKLKPELDHHAAAEDQTLYAAMLGESLTQDKARHSVAEHKQIDDLLSELGDTELDSPAWLPKAKKLAELVEHHLDEEEHEVFQMAGKILTKQAEQELAERYEALRSEPAND